MAIETVHLLLIPYSPEHLLALIEGDECFEACFGLPAADGLVWRWERSKESA